jgi:hypothetical protein
LVKGDCDVAESNYLQHAVPVGEPETVVDRDSRAFNASRVSGHAILERISQLTKATEPFDVPGCLSVEQHRTGFVSFLRAFPMDGPPGTEPEIVRFRASQTTS